MKVKWDDSTSARENARRELPTLLDAYYLQVHQELAKDQPAAKLHRLRLATKKLRYTLELFRDCCGDEWESDLEKLRKLQQALGDINDCVAAWRLLSRKMPRGGERNRMKKYLDRRTRKLVKELQAA
jgi:CHAD domain-containing protein